MKKLPLLFISGVLLLATAIGYDYLSPKAISDDYLSIEIAKNLGQELAMLETEAQLILSDTLTDWSTLKKPFFLLENGKIKKWSKTDYPVDEHDFEGDDKLKLVQTPRKDWIVYQSLLGNGKSLVGIIPLRTGFEITNRYLFPSWNEKIFPIQGVKILNNTSVSSAQVCLGSDCLFRVQAPTGVLSDNKISLALTLAAILSFLYGIFYKTRQMQADKKYFSGFLFLFLALAGIRIAMVQLLFPERWMYSRFFDSKYFASSSFNASPGDFFLNALIVTLTCAYIFRIYSRFDFVKKSYKVSTKRKWLLTLLLLTASYFSFLFPHLFVESIFHDSSISIDVTTGVAFDGLRILILLAFVFGCISSFLFVTIFVRWARLMKPGEFTACLLLSALLFTSYFLFSGLNYWITLFVGTVYFLLIYSLSYLRVFAIVGYRTFSFLIIAIIAYAAQGALGIWRFSEEQKLRSMFSSAANLINRDVLGEYLLNETSLRISNDPFINASLDNPLLSKNIVRQKIKQQLLSNYFDRYAVTINFYHADGNPADSESSTDFASFLKDFQDEANKTGYNGIYRIRSSSDETVKHYLAVIQLNEKNNLQGYVILDLSLKRFTPRQVYPELLVDNRFAQSIDSRDFSYIFFNHGKSIGNFGSFNFERDFDTRLLNDLRLYSTGIKYQDNWIVAAEDDAGKRAAVVVKEYPAFYILANFSFLFVIGVALVILLMILYSIDLVRRRQTLNYSTRIQIYAYLAFLLPLIVVSTIALRLITQSNEAQLEKEIRDKGQLITESVSGLLDKINSNELPDELKNKLAETTRASNVDANLFSQDGKLLATSQPTIFKDQLTMPLPDRGAWEKIVVQKYNTVNVQAHIGSLEYTSSFFAIKSASTGQLVGILELPFFESGSESAKINVLTNILVTFTVVFILFSFLTFNTINKLTSPLRFIAKKLKATTLDKNQPMEWKANDEIGLMVKEYNKMLSNLEQSKTQLTLSQKENAWREIAQQVAHEIRNPLTPMKLTLQQLEQVMVNGSLTSEKTQQSVKMLMAQVETLNNIAGSFSAFAAMPELVLSRVDVAELIPNAVALFENHGSGEVRFEESSKPVFIQGDRQLLGRIFSNIILNGLQSGSKGKSVSVEISILPQDEYCIIRFRDNGTGIVPELREKIFLPHFSTKKTGSGLGLAIAKQGIEQMGGEIWFETNAQSGTTFFIKLERK